MKQVERHIILFLFCFLAYSLISYSQCDLYSVNFIANQDSTSEYNVSCGNTSASHWVVSDDTCDFKTSSIDLGGTIGNVVATPISIDVNPAGNLVDCDDYIIIQYRIDSTTWVTQDSINACDSNFNTSVQTFNFNVVCGDTSAIEVRVLMAVGDNNSTGGSSPEKMRIMDNGICVGLPFTLPIELIDFSAQVVDNDVIINWTTASETENNFFTIERSSDGIDFEEIAQINGAGSSVIISSYEYIDTEPLFGMSYYRLKQTDFNGQYEYFSPVAVEVRLSTTDNFKIYPNPCDNGRFFISVKEDKVCEILVVLYDLTGKELFTTVVVTNSFGETVTAIDTEGKLSPGVYLVIGSSDSKIYKQKLVISDDGFRATASSFIF